ncbi:MAG TPA: hypothetical protein VHY48_11840 [Acidobacteriaceae bacterium]|nr:hypothetical protein [Acidobacteriaceae bacterium]
MRPILQFAAIALLATAATYTRAQITPPDQMIPQPPPNPARGPVHPIDDLQWLWPFAQPQPLGRATELRLDARFQLLLHESFNRPQSFWGTANEPLDLIIPLFLSGHGAVTAEDNRYLAIDGCVPSFCAAHGLLWIDLGTRHPLIVFAAVNWTTEGHTTEQAAADYNLWLYPNRDLSPDALPFALSSAIAHWDARLAAAHRLVPHIAHALLVEPNGSPYALTPSLVGANTLPPQPDTSKDQQPHSSKLTARN